jgi:2-polyprenyl-3-methyl-5-hydroxy-6-metoxy-1,4-benzoquinol methylase
MHLTLNLVGNLAAVALLSPPRVLIQNTLQRVPQSPVLQATALDADAQALLEECGGDVDKARQSYIGYTLQFLKEAQPELYEAIRTDASAPDAHAALVELTWDAVAAFLPLTHAPKPTTGASQKLTAIARTGIDGRKPEECQVLDVGCGNGLLLPFLTACGSPPANYRGIDISSRMIQRALDAHSGDAEYREASFDDCSLDDVCADNDGQRYDVVIFNGALQFFRDPSATLAKAAALLAPGEDSRLVISHLNGASFVRKEREDNPSTVLSTMPTLAELEATASQLGLLALTPTFFGTDAPAIEEALDEFYLVSLRWDAEHGGWDGGAPATASGEDY